MKTIILRGLFFALLCGGQVMAQRIAISEDGNYHDTDDYDACSVSIGLLAHAGSATDLVHYDHSNHYWLTTSNRQSIMRDGIIEAMSRFGGFNSNVVFDAVTNHGGAVTNLTAQINASSACNELEILAMGPMQIIGEALAASSPSARQYVTVYSHSTWNDNHATQVGPGEGLPAPRYNFSSLANLGAKTVHIRDQNAGLNKPFSQFYWMRDSRDTALQFLWQRGQLAGKSTYDCSDAGLAYYILTGDQSATPQKLEALLTQ